VDAPPGRRLRDRTIERVACALCGADRPQPVVRRRGDRYLRALRITPAAAPKVMCAACGHIYENPQLDARELERLYRDLYRSSALGYREHGPDAEYLYWKTRKAERDRQWLSRHVPESLAGARVLEIGCAEGLLLSMLARDGCRVVGVETTDSYAEHARATYGVDVRNLPFEQAEFGAERFDLVVALKVLEHVKDPLAFMRKVGRLLQPGGTFYFTVPNALRPDQTPHEFLASVHLSLFTTQSVRRLLAAGGFEPVHVDDAEQYLSVLARPSAHPAAVADDRPLPVTAVRRAIRRYRLRSRVRTESVRMRRAVKAGLYAVAGPAAGAAIWTRLKARLGRP
jgi:2-polyprenyl-3-methyl-5-hydroxy-6-metoxy-1,4-benzoquinol methylase